jgi:hypothetical protein
MLSLEGKDRRNKCENRRDNSADFNARRFGRADNFRRWRRSTTRRRCSASSSGSATIRSAATSSRSSACRASRRSSGSASGSRRSGHRGRNGRESCHPQIVRIRSENEERKNEEEHTIAARDGLTIDIVSY